MARMLGEVDLLGLGSFGLDQLNSGPFKGAAVGAAATVAGRIVAQPTSWWVGPGMGAAAALILSRFDKTKDWSTGAIVGTLLTSGIVEKVLSGLASALGIKSNLSGHSLGLPSINYLNGNLGLPDVSWEPPVYGTGLGLPTIAPEPPAYGVWNKNISSLNGVAGPQLGANVPPVDLLGPQTAQTQQLELMGGPPVSGLSAAYGATLFGPNS